MELNSETIQTMPRKLLLEKTRLAVANTKFGLAIAFPCDLRASLDMKMFEANPKARWTAFINNAGTLCHVVCPDAEILIRLVFKKSVKTMSSYALLSLVQTRLGDYIKL